MIAVKQHLCLLVLLSTIVIVFSACSYLFSNGVEGRYLSSNRPVLGYVSSRNEKERGEISIGSLEKLECNGDYAVTDPGFSIFGTSIKEQKFKGNIYCSDGRIGTFELVSKTQGQTGIIAGIIGSEAFTANLYEVVNENCSGNEFCRFGVKWNYVKQKNDLLKINSMQAKAEVKN
jgi:hypothetical protein